MHLAAKNGHNEAVQLLLENGADITARDNNGKTALHDTTKNRHEAVALLLIKKGAYITAKDRYGRTALHEVLDNKHEMVARLLLTESDVEAKVDDIAADLHREAADGMRWERGCC